MKSQMQPTDHTEIERFDRRASRWVKVPTITTAAARRLCDEIASRTELLDKPTKLNKNITHRQAVEIFRASLTGGDNEPIRTLIARNIQRVAGVPRDQQVKA